MLDEPVSSSLATVEISTLYDICCTFGTWAGVMAIIGFVATKRFFILLVDCSDNEMIFVVMDLSADKIFLQ